MLCYPHCYPVEVFISHIALRVTVSLVKDGERAGTRTQDLLIKSRWGPDVVAGLALELVVAGRAIDGRIVALRAFDRCCHVSALHCERSAGRLPSNFAHLGETPGRSAGRPEAFVPHLRNLLANPENGFSCRLERSTGGSTRP